MLDPALYWKKLLAKAKELNATDIHFSNPKICMRLKTLIVPVNEKQDQYLPILHYFMDETHLKTLEELGEVDFAASHDGHRLRCNVYKSIKGHCGSFRPLPTESYPIEKMMLSKEIIDLTTKSNQGLVLVAGPTGSGKSTLLCSILDYINANYAHKIVTLEDPIEFIFEDKKSIIDQREIGPHTKGFHEALRAAMRQNPNVIFVGEIRDYATALTAMHAAETGHLVFSTLHIKRVANTISRIIEMAPANGRGEIRSIIANNVLAVICQRLLPRKDGTGIIPCREILVMNPAASSYIKEGKEKSLPSVMNSNREKGMIDWDNAIGNLLKSDLITQQTFNANEDKADKIG